MPVNLLVSKFTGIVNVPFPALACTPVLLITLQVIYNNQIPIKKLYNKEQDKSPLFNAISAFSIPATIDTASSGLIGILLDYM